MPEPQETLGPYTLLGKIGAGGMGEVHLAMDPRLERRVALKLLPSDLRDDPERRQRFLREARAAAKLSHPNVMAIHEVGQADGRDYIAFEYVEGQTLDAILRERVLPLPELIDLALPLADALAYAHERGVIHRDLKAANVMVTTRGHAKLLDFGLAKLFGEEDASRKSKTTALTMEGAVFGTPQAMSPEQALGRAVDARSDVFSFGSLLYEMAAGRAAFAGATVMEVVDAVIHAEPTDLTRLRPDLPAEFAAIVAKAMRKDPAERYPSISGLVADLKHFKRSSESGPVPLARQRRSLLPAALLAAVVAAAGLAWWFRGTPASVPGAAGAPTAVAHSSIAVMGFELIGSFGAETEGTNLDRALTSLVTTALAEAGGIEVASSSKVVACLRRAGQPAGAAFDPGIAAAAALEAQVELMLVGQVLSSGSGLHLTAELVDVASGNALGSLRRDVASPEDLFALAEGLAVDVRQRLGLGGGSHTVIDLERDLTSSPEAYYKFVAGEMALHEARFDDARRLLTQATEIDPSFAFAYLRLGMANEWDAGPAAAAKAYEAALANAQRLPERWRRLVHVVLAYSHGELERAYGEVQALIAEGHALPEAFNTLGEILTHSSRRSDPLRSRAAFLQALEIDPNFQIVLYHVVGHSLMLGDIAPIEVLLEELRGQGANPEGIAYLELGLALARHDYAAAASQVEASGRQVDDMEEYDWALNGLGRVDDVEALLAFPSPPPGTNGLRNQLQLQGNLAFRRGRLGEARRLYLAESEAMSGSERPQATWYSGNTAMAKLRAARATLLLGSLDEACELLDEGLLSDPYRVELLFWKVRWLSDAGRTEQASRELERMRTLVADCTSPIAAGWLVLAETELRLVAGDLSGAREGLATLALAPRGEGPWGGHELVRARVARAAGDAAAEVAALRAALHASRDFSEPEPGILYSILYELADAEERAGMPDEAQRHARELLDAWSESPDDIALLADARRRWGD